jgi:hypothetical protein
VKEAYEKAIEYKKLISDGIVPIEYKRHQKLQTQTQALEEIKKCLEPIWVTKHHTTEKLKSHLAKILRWATAVGQRKRDDNPTDQNRGALSSHGACGT